MSSSSDHSPDIFPQVQVGLNASGSVEIGPNGMFISGRKVPDEYHQHRVKRDGSRNFYMEPGR